MCSRIIFSTDAYGFFQDYQHVMGLSGVAYWLGYFLRNSLIGIIQGCLCLFSFVMITRPSFKIENTQIIAFGIAMFTATYTAQAMLVSTLFGNGEFN